MTQEKKRFSPARFYRINIIFFIMIMVLGLLVFLLAVCSVRQVRVYGNTIYTDAQLEEIVLNDRYKSNGAWEVVRNRLHPRRDIPFVSKTEVSLKGFHTLVIRVSEKQIAGYIDGKDDNHIYLDREGRVAEVNKKLLSSAIPVSGLSTKKRIVTGKSYPVAENRITALRRIFHAKTSMNLNIDSVNFGDSGEISLSCGSVTVKMGTSDGLKEKLLRLSYILPKVAGESGTLHFENFSSDNTDIVFDAD